MSYSFSARGATKAEALAKAEEEMQKVVAGQPTHAKDADLAREHREKCMALVEVDTAPEGQEFYLSCNGSLSWLGSGDSVVIVGASVSAYAGITPKA